MDPRLYPKEIPNKSLNIYDADSFEHIGWAKHFGDAMKLIIQDIGEGRINNQYLIYEGKREEGGKLFWSGGAWEIGEYLNKQNPNRIIKM
jgi:hypothetical protein